MDVSTCAILALRLFFTLCNTIAMSNYDHDFWLVIVRNANGCPSAAQRCVTLSEGHDSCPPAQQLTDKPHGCAVSTAFCVGMMQEWLIQILAANASKRACSIPGAQQQLRSLDPACWHSVHQTGHCPQSFPCRLTPGDHSPQSSPCRLAPGHCPQSSPCRLTPGCPCPQGCPCCLTHSCQRSLSWCESCCHRYRCLYLLSNHEAFSQIYIAGSGEASQDSMTGQV